MSREGGSFTQTGPRGGMFHVEHLLVGPPDDHEARIVPQLVVHTEQEDDAEDDCCKQDLSHVVVEDLLIRVRGVAEAGFFRG
jgi:hypothetical protein